MIFYRCNRVIGQSEGENDFDSNVKDVIVFCLCRSRSRSMRRETYEYSSKDLD